MVYTGGSQEYTVFPAGCLKKKAIFKAKSQTVAELKKIVYLCS